MLYFGLVISLIFAVVTFIGSNNIFVTLFILFCSFIYFLVIARPIYKKYDLKVNRFHQCYHFINSFIVSLSIKNSLSGAYESSMSAMPDDFISRVENLDTFDQKEKLENLNKYFRFHAFSLFLDLVNIYEEQGGDILSMSHYLLEETRLTEEYISENNSIARKKITEFAILWFLTLLIVVILRFALSSFYGALTKQIYYVLGIGGVFIFALVSIHITLLKMTKLEIKGWHDNEKN